MTFAVRMLSPLSSSALQTTSTVSVCLIYTTLVVTKVVLECLRQRGGGSSHEDAEVDKPLILPPSLSRREHLPFASEVSRYPGFTYRLGLH